MLARLTLGRLADTIPRPMDATTASRLSPRPLRPQRLRPPRSAERGEGIGSRVTAPGEARAFALARLCAAALALVAAAGCPAAESAPPREGDAAPPAAAPAADLRLPGEAHLGAIRQLTFGGQNAEAYFSGDDRRLIFQSERPPFGCDQIFTMNADGSDVRLVSTGKGRTTCSYFFPDGSRVLYASTHEASPECPPKPDYSRGYVWALYPGFDIFTAKPDGSDLRRITDNPLYDAEAVVSPDGSRVVFTSLRDGDLDLYTMRPDGSDVRRVTSELGYDGGAFFSPDGERLVYRAHHPKTEQEMADYKALLAQNLIRPTTLEIFVCDVDGSNRRQVTSLGKASFAPYMHPDGKRIIFASNVHDPKGRDFDLYLVNVDGTGLERVTRNETFDGFPMFSRDGKKLVFASNRNGKVRGETNVFIADWVD
jgi:Tol biopolymer transport system component